MLGLGVFFLGRFSLERLLGGLSKYIFIVGGIFIILIGMLMITGNRLESSRIWRDSAKAGKFCGLLQDKLLKRDKKSIVILGIIIGLLPCAPLIAVLSYLGLVSKSWLRSLLYSLSFGLGAFVSPLILLTTLSGLLGHWMQDKKYYQIFSFICGLVVIFLGLQLIARSF
jgi:sulfite exporter TauE/SafE